MELDNIKLREFCHDYSIKQCELTSEHAFAGPPSFHTMSEEEYFCSRSYEPLVNIKIPVSQLAKITNAHRRESVQKMCRNKNTAVRLAYERYLLLLQLTYGDEVLE